MDAIFQQAPFDDKKDIRRIEEICKDVEQRAKKCQVTVMANVTDAGEMKKAFQGS